MKDFIVTYERGDRRVSERVRGHEAAIIDRALVIRDERGKWLYAYRTWVKWERA
jgi:hypothetical protein